MKKILSFICSLCVAATAMAQVNMEGLTSEQLTDGQTYYIVSTSGYFVSTKGSGVITTDVAPEVAEWKAIKNADDTYSFRLGAKYLGSNAEKGGISIETTPTNWNVVKGFDEGTYSFWANVYFDLWGDVAEDDQYFICADNGEIGTTPTWYMEGEGDCNLRDFLFFSTLPEQIDNRTSGGGGDEDDDLVDVPVNDIEGDFPANWAKDMQDAKVMTYGPMDKNKVYMQYWMPHRKGVYVQQTVIFREDVVKKFYGNKVKNIWLMLPPNADQVEIFIMDPLAQSAETAALWSDYYDFTKTVEKIMAKPNGVVPHYVTYSDGKTVQYGNDLNMELKDPDDPYYKHSQIVGIPCDFEITDKYPNLQIGYMVHYPGEYKDHYVNGKNPQGGVTDGYWWSTSYLLPTSRYYYAFMLGDTDPEIHNGYSEDYTRYTEPMKEEYRWTENATMFCFVETEGNGGFQHVDLDFDEVSVARCFTGDSKVPVSAWFTNYGVDPIKTARFNVQMGETNQTIRYKDGINFLEIGNLEDDIKAPTEPTRMDMNITVTHINGKEVNLKTNINGSLIAVNEHDNVKRLPVVEENTGTWCGWCPRGMVGMEMLRETYGEDVALIGIHSGMDPKANGMMDEVIGYVGLGAAPSCAVNRVFKGDPYYGSAQKNFGISADVENAKALISEATVKFANVERSSDGKHVAVETNTTFSIDSEKCPYDLTYVITEDGLMLGQQMNYYTTGQVKPEELKTSSPDLYPLTQKPTNWRPEFNDVMSYSAPCMGIEGSLTGAIKKGESKNHKYVIDIPKGSQYVNDITSCRLIALLLDRESREIVNACQMFLGDAKVNDANESFTGIGTVINENQNANENCFDLSGRSISTPTSGSRMPLIMGGRKVIK